MEFDGMSKEFDDLAKDIQERLTKVEEAVAQKGEDLSLYGKMTMRELYALANKKKLTEQLHSFYESDYGKMTVKELLTSTSNVALPNLVQSRALLELKNWVDARDLCMRATVPKGSGKTVDTQIITAADFQRMDRRLCTRRRRPDIDKTNNHDETLRQNNPDQRSTGKSRARLFPHYHAQPKISETEGLAAQKVTKHCGVCRELVTAILSEYAD